MVRLLVIADDFTGALDTGVQFRTGKTLVIVYTGDDSVIRRELQLDIQVLIIDAETRHLAPEEAYRIVFGIAATARELGVSFIYKKTDSGMRGNIGSELTALLDASGEEQIHFFPAFPRMGRITRGGIHYIDGVPVAESIFGRDPFEPVRSSSVKEIIAAQSATPVISVQGEESRERTSQKCERASTDHFYASRNDTHGILVYDSTTDEEMTMLGELLKQNDRFHLTAGCAGFASVLFRLLGFKAQEREPEILPGRLLVICGSINAVTVGQLDYASGAGIRREVLTAEEKLEIDWPDSPKGIRRIRGFEEKLQNTDALMIECGVHDLEMTAEAAALKGLSQEDIRQRISETMGGVLKRMLDDGVSGTLLVTGGDTLMAFMRKISTTVLEPVCELFPGVVLSHLEYGGRIFNLVTKSGGFGQEDLITRLRDKLGS